MNDKTNDRSTTVQRRETSVPVVFEGGGAGPTRPSAFDCGSGVVGNQALQVSNITGCILQEDPFRRRSSLPRSPPEVRVTQSRRMKEAASATGSESDSSYSARAPSIIEDEDVFEKQKIKRKRIVTPEKDDAMLELREFRRLMGKLTKSCEIMKNLVETNPNTKVELKKEIATIGVTMGMLRKKCKEWDVLPGDSQPKTVDPPKGSKVSVGTQTIREDKDQEIYEIRDDLEKGRTFDELAKIIDLDWPEETYKVAKIARDSIVEATRDKDTALVIDPQVATDKGFMKTIVSMNPEINNLLGQGLQIGEIEYLKNEVKTETSRGVKEKRKYIHMLPMTIDEGGINDISLLHKLFVGLREELRRLDRTELTIVTQDGIDRGYVRKVIEHVFLGTQMDIQYLIPGGKGAAATQKMGRAGKPRNTEEKVLVKGGNASYADLLKSIKGGVDIKGLGIEVTQLRKTAAGDLLLTVRSDNNQADTLRAEISAKVQGANVMKRKSDQETCIVTGIDEITTERELLAGLREETKLPDDSIKILSIKQGKYGSQTALIELPKADARRLTQKGFVKIGWLRCRIAERVRLTRCYRCLEFGHRAFECRNAVTKDTCLKCGQDGHKAKECVNTPYCTACKEANHRADQMACPQFRKMVESKRRRLSSRK